MARRYRAAAERSRRSATDGEADAGGDHDAREEQERAQLVPGDRGRDEHPEERGGERAGGERARQEDPEEVRVDDEVEPGHHRALVEERGGEGGGVAGGSARFQEDARDQETDAPDRGLEDDQPERIEL